MADFHLTSANDGTTLIRPVSARAEVFWKENNFFKYVVDNEAEHYVILDKNRQKICDEIRNNDMDFVN
jgi:hypothetical protein